MSKVTEKALYMLRSMYPTETVVEMLQHEELMQNAEAIAEIRASIAPKRSYELRDKVFTVDEAIMDLARFDTRLQSNYPHLLDQEFLRSDAENYEEFLKRKESV